MQKTQTTPKTPKNDLDIQLGIQLDIHFLTALTYTFYHFYIKL